MHTPPLLPFLLPSLSYPIASRPLRPASVPARRHPCVDANDPPTCAAHAIITVPLTSKPGDLLGAVRCEDQDEDTTGAAAWGRLWYAITAGNTGDAVRLLNGSLLVRGNDTSRAFDGLNKSLVISFIVTDGGGLEAAGNFTLVVATVSVNLNPSAPVLPSRTLSVLENTPRSTWVGPPLVGTDADVGQVLSYALYAASNLGGAFSVDAFSAQLAVANASALDFEITPTIWLILMATDDGTPHQSVNATITVNLVSFLAVREQLEFSQLEFSLALHPS